MKGGEQLIKEFIYLDINLTPNTKKDSMGKYIKCKLIRIEVGKCERGKGGKET